MTTLSVEIVIESRDPYGLAIDVAFDVPPGVTVLFGPSGAGKSRTLGCIAGLARPDRGRIALGEDVWFDSRTALPIHRRRVAYVFQSLALFPHMTAAENVAYGMAADMPKDARRTLASSMLAKMQVAHLAERRPRTFSGGEAQRVALARAFAMRPRVVLLDEPFSALDFGLKTELLLVVARELAEEKVPVLLVTHQPEDARVLGDRVVFIDEGRVKRTAPMSDDPFTDRAPSLSARTE